MYNTVKILHTAKDDIMTVKLNLMITAVIALFIIYVCYLLIKHKMTVKVALPWLAMIVAVLLLVWWPNLAKSLADDMGVAVPINAIFFMGFCVLILINFFQARAIGQLEKRVIRLAQQLALATKNEGDNHEQEG